MVDIDGDLRNFFMKIFEICMIFEKDLKKGFKRLIFNFKLW